MEIRRATINDVESVLKLQKLYLYDNLTEEERKGGFVTTPFTVAQLESIIAENGLFIAVDTDQVVAYVFAGSWDYFSQWPIFPYMTSYFPQLKFQDLQINTHNSFQYGPVCVDSAYRGSGLLISLFEVMRENMVKMYPLGATFINKANPRSLNAHVNKLGWKVVGEFQYNSKDYNILIFDMSKSVLTLKRPDLRDPAIN